MSRRYISYLLLVASMLAVFLSFPLARTVSAAGTVYYVGTSSDDAGTNTALCTNPANSVCSLRAAITAATSGSDTIVWNDNATGQITLTHGELVLSHSVSLSGPGGSVVQLDGNGISRVLHVTAGAIQISGLTIQNGMASDLGGGIYVQGGSVTLFACAVAKNGVTSTATNLAGGGIYAAGNVTLIDTTVSNNHATSFETAAAGSQLYGGGIAQVGGTLTVTGSTISGNTLQWLSPNVGTVNGGGIYNQGTLVLTNSTVSGNQVNSSFGGGTGGGISNNGTATLTDSTIVGNSVGRGQGGGIYNQMPLAVTSVTVTGNGAGQGGGVYVTSGATATLTDALISGNSATSGPPDAAGTVADASRNNLIGNGAGLSGIGDNTNGNHIGTSAAPLDPKLDPNGLQANGSPRSQTIALLPNSPAIDAGGTCPDADSFTDQRGKPRIAGCDIGAYEYQPVTPTVTDTTAPASGGDATFHGTGFQTGTQLTVAGTTVTAPTAAVTADGTAVTLPVPAHQAGSTPIRLTNPGIGHVAMGTLTYVPVIANLSPSSGLVAGGVSVTIAGAGFGTDTAQVTVRFGAASATLKSVSDTQLVVTIPAGNGTVDVIVTVNGASATKTGAYTYGATNALPAPAVPGSGSGKPIMLPGSRPASGSPASGSPNALPNGR